MNSLSDCKEYLHWQYLTHFTLSTTPQKALVAPSRNILSAEAFANRQQAIVIDDKISNLITANGLTVPTEVYPSLPLTDHCLGMSLHFAKVYRQTHDIKTAATLMQAGTTLESAKTTALYDEIFYANANDSFEATKELLEKSRNIVANTLDLAFSEEISLNRPYKKILPYLEHELPPGEYLIPLISHVVVLIKDKQGKLYLYNSSPGTIDLTESEGKENFLALMKKHKVHLSEKLSLLKIADFKAENQNKLQVTEVPYRETPSSLTYEKGTGRWGVAVFAWRGKEMRLTRDSETGHIYNSDSKNLVRLKCFLLPVRTLIDGVVRTIYNMAQALFKMIGLIFVSNPHQKQVLIESIKKSVEDIFRAPTYAILGAMAAFYGVFDPYGGRDLYGYFERSLNRQNNGVNFNEKFYVAPCFTPWNLNHQHDQAETIAKIKKMFLATESFHGNSTFELFCAWRKAIPCLR